MAYAEKTTVPVERSRAEVERTLRTHGATSYCYMDRTGYEYVACAIYGLTLSWRVAVPQPEAFTHTAAGRRRTKADAMRAAKGEHRRRWRALLLLIKAKFEVIESGLMDARTVFLQEAVAAEQTAQITSGEPKPAETRQLELLPAK